MDLNEKNKIALNHVRFNKSRFRKYIGIIGEIVVREVLRKKGFEVWLVTAYYLEDEKVGGGLFNLLSWMYKDEADSSWEPEEKKSKNSRTFLGVDWKISNDT